MKAVGVALGVLVGVAAFGAWLDVRALPKGGTITVLDEFDQPIQVTPEDAAWKYTPWETFKTWLTGQLPGG